MVGKRVLLVEDEQAIADTIIYVFQSEGYEIIHHNLANLALQTLTEVDVSLIIIDVGLPDMSGFELCREIRKSSDVPLLFLTARNDEIDRIIGFELGADDYVCKPFSPRELTARAKAILKRSDNTAGINELAQSKFSVDAKKYEITYHGNVVDLTRYEFTILNALLARPGQVFTREQLIQGHWQNPEEIFDRVIDTHIKQIRAKLRKINAKSKAIKTHRGIGYSINTQS